LISRRNPFFISVGGGNEIGASSYFLSLCGTDILIDAGLRLNSERTYPRYEHLYENGVIDGLWDLSAVLLTHGHLDHIGSLPKVVEEAPLVPVYATAGTKDIVQLQLEDMVRVGERRAQSRPETAAANYMKFQVEQALSNIRTREWGVPVTVGNAEVTFFPAGHILGAACIYVRSERLNVLITGDFSDFHQYSVDPLSLPEGLDVDVLITETTYGYQEQSGSAELSLERQTFLAQITDVVFGGGTVLIPAFAVGRAQEVAMILTNAIAVGDLPPIEIYLDGLAKGATAIYEKHGRAVFGKYVKPAPLGLHSSKREMTGVVISSSGMLVGHSCSSRYAQKLLPRAENALFFTGYLDEDSPGKKLQRLRESRGGHFQFEEKAVPVNALVDTYRLSAHASCAGILGLIERVRPRKVVFVHGCPNFAGKTDIMRDAFLRFGSSVEFHQSLNGSTIHL